MTIHRLRDLRTPIGEVLGAADQDGVMIEVEEQPLYALLPLDDDLLDFLLEHNPRLIAESRQLRQRMEAGEFMSHEEVLAELDKSA
jgi:hypothetical protein